MLLLVVKHDAGQVELEIRRKNVDMYFRQLSADNLICLAVKTPT
jgi:hypothetical protein